MWKTPFVLFALLFAASSTPAKANPECAAYARSAVQQVKAAAASRCGFTGSRWSSNEGVHYRYCLANSGRRQSNLARETEQRNTALKQCQFRRHF